MLIYLFKRLLFSFIHVLVADDDDIVRRETLEELRVQIKAEKDAYKEKVKACGVKHKFVPMEKCFECRATCRGNN